MDVNDCVLLRPIEARWIEMYLPTKLLKYFLHFRYEGPLLEDGVFGRAIEEGATSPEYTKLVEWVTTELRGFFGLEEKVSAVSGKSLPISTNK